MKRFWKRLVGYEHNYGGRDRSLHFTWGEIAYLTWDVGLRLKGPEYCYEPKLIVSLVFVMFYIRIPWFKTCTNGNGNGQSFGFYLYPSLKHWEDTVFEWGFKSARWYMPWTYVWERTDLLDWQMKVVTSDIAGHKGWDDFYKASQAYAEANKLVYDYTYTRKNGEKQVRKATIKYIERRVWHMRCWPWKKHIQTSIEIDFNEEVGERAGSWKGGCVGCGWSMLPGETPELTLRRMERERKFN